MKKRKQNKRNSTAKGFVIGIVVALLILSAVPASALYGKDVTIYPGVNIYVDDVLFEPKDANGNPVEAFIYNGTTYLPVRAIGNAFGKNIAWEGATSSVYIGKHESNQPAVWLDEMDYFFHSGDYFVKKTSPVEDNYGNKYNRWFYSSRKDEKAPVFYAPSINDCSYIYLLNGQYSRITGTCFITHNQRSLSVQKGAGLEIYGDDVLLYTNRVTKNITQYEPNSFDVDLTGVLRLEIKLFDCEQPQSDSTTPNTATFCVGECGLWS